MLQRHEKAAAIKISSRTGTVFKAISVFKAILKDTLKSSKMGLFL